LPNDLASKWIEECGDLVHEPTVRKEICPHIKPGDVVVDAGAYLGAHTKAYLEAVGRTGKVIAFEPNPEAFKCLFHNCPSAECHNEGLGRGKFEKRRRYDGQPDNYGASYWKWESLPEHNGAKVFGPLDFWGLPRLNFLKIDVEGMECDVIAGAAKTLFRCRPIIYIELNRLALSRFGTNQRTLVSMIEMLDYRLQFMRPEHNLDCAEINVFFFPK